MPNLLLTTPEYLLRYDVAERQVYVLEEGRAEYYGISWFKGSNQIYMSHSGLEGAGLTDMRTYVESEVGWLSKGSENSWPFLSLPHQILCLDNGMILTTNTGRNCLTLVNSADWSIRHHWFDSRLWDRLGVGEEGGSHFNSVTKKGQYLYVLAHNFSKGSYTLVLECPGLHPVDLIQHQATGLHNIWAQSHEMLIACDSPHGSLISLRDGRTLWRSGDSAGMTRGLAASAERIYVGASVSEARAVRRTSETGIWIVDSNRFTTVDYHSLGHFGGVHEVRLMDETDLCHPQGPLPPDRYIGSPAAQFFSRRRLAAISDRAAAEERWNISMGVPACGNASVDFKGDALCIALLPNSRRDRFQISGLLDVSQRNAQHCGLIGRYQGPSDTRMIAAVLARNPTGAASLGLWRENGADWTCLGARCLPRLSAMAELSGEGSRFVIRCGEMEPIVAEDPSVPTEGAVGVRGVGGTIGNIHSEALSWER